MLDVRVMRKLNKLVHNFVPSGAKGLKISRNLKCYRENIVDLENAKK